MENNINIVKTQKKFNLIKNVSISIISLILFFSIGELLTRIFLGAPLVIQPDSELFWKYKRNQTGHQKLYTPISKVDKNGFRYTGKDFNENLPTIYIGGDSYAWGEGVLDSETLPSQLEIILKSKGLEYNVLNGGVPGYGIEQIIRRMERECIKYKPRYAIFMWVEDDFNRLRDISSKQKSKFLRDYKIRAIFRYSAFLKMFKEQLFDKILHKDLALGFNGDIDKKYANAHSFDDKAKGLTNIIKSNNLFLKNNNIIPVWIFVTLPTEAFKKYLYSLSNDMKIELINPDDLYQKRFPGLQNMKTKHSDHFNAEVYEILAKEIYLRIFKTSQQ